MVYLNDVTPFAAPLVTLIVGIVAVRPVFREYKLKARAEERLARAGAAETDIRLCNAFLDLVIKAHSRATSQLSEAVVKKLIDAKVIAVDSILDSDGQLDHERAFAFRERLSAVVVPFPSGMSEHVAAVAAIAELADSYELIRVPALAALEAMNTKQALEARRSILAKCTRPAWYYRAPGGHSMGSKRRNIAMTSDSLCRFT